MYRRKVQITGGSTFFVTLPKDWATSAGIQGKDEIRLIPTETNALLLIPQRGADANRCRIDLGEWGFDRLQREVFSRYIAGYNIEVRGERIHPRQRRSVRQAAQALVGLEILEETQSTVVLHSVVDIKDFPIGRTLRRIYEITRAMFADAATAFLEFDSDLAEDVQERDGDVDRLVLLIARQLNLLLRDLVLPGDVQLSKVEFLHHNEVADQLERIADHAGKISEAATALTRPVPEEVAESVRLSSEASMKVLDEAMNAFLDQDVDRANAVLSEKGIGDKLFEQALLKSPMQQPENSYPIGIFLDSCLRISEYSYNIAENAIDASVPLHNWEAEKPEA